MTTNTLKETVKNEFPGLKTKEAITFAEIYLQMTDDERDLFLKIMDMTIGNTARCEFAQNWKGKINDLPAALAQI